MHNANRLVYVFAQYSHSYILIKRNIAHSLDKSTENDILKIFQRLAKEYNKCVIIVMPSDEAAEKADVAYRLKPIKN